MAKAYNVNIEGTVEVKIRDDLVAVALFARGADPEWTSAFYGDMNQDEILKHLAFNAASNGITDASRLDGFADLPAECVQMTFTVDEVDPSTSNPGGPNG